MKLSSVFTLVLISIFALFAVSGCIFNSPSEGEKQEDPEVAAIDQDFGGLSTTDEHEAFGDDNIATEYDDDEPVSDLLDEDPTLATDMNNPQIDVYFLRLTWGLLEGDSTATLDMDWSGNAEINKGALVLLKKVRFEGNDQITRPRTSKLSLEWQSYTRPHFDGLCLAIIDNDTTQKELAGQLTLNVGMYSQTFTFAQLDSMNLLEPVGADGHEISIISRKKSVVPFAGGFLEGNWERKDSLGGVFYGKWINSMGTRVGLFRGIWGTNRIGQNVMFGKWIDLRGRFQGLLAGSWGYAEDGNSGWIEGRWVNKSLITAGKFEAKWKTAEPGSGKGFFHGKWKRRL